jgi:hypothetical protein
MGGPRGQHFEGAAGDAKGHWPEGREATPIHAFINKFKQADVWGESLFQVTHVYGNLLRRRRNIIFLSKPLKICF